MAVARRAARLLAERQGFDSTGSEEIALVVAELAWNLVKHARGGKLALTPITASGRLGIEIESVDRGPGIPAIDWALQDGVSTAGSLGYGLGTVNRLMDRLDISSEPEQGTRIVCQKWVRTQEASATPCPLEFGVASRAHPQMDVNGDAFVLTRWEDNALVGVIDGLGHGPLALRAAQAARRFVETHCDQPLEEIFRGVEHECKATRGVVMALSRFDWIAGTMSFASIGNIEARLLGYQEPENFVVRRGVLGSGAPKPKVSTHRWQRQCLLVLHSDGISSHWQREDVTDFTGQSASDLAAILLRRFAKLDDDATVLVVRGERHE
ncbi:MAG: ATP-binding protein [Gemmataceae bacterium]